MLRIAKLPVVAVVLMLAAHPSMAQDAPPSGDDSSWTALADDASRASLFDDRIIPAKLEEEQQGAGNPVDLAIPKEFYFPGDVRTDVIKNKPREGSIFGIDVSHYTNKTLNLAVLRLQGVRFVYVKATQGTAFKDGEFAYFWDKLHGLPAPQAVSVGAYHFLSAGLDGTEQAKRFIDFVTLHGGFKPSDMPPCLDLEWDVTASNPDRWSSVPNDEIIRNVTAWLDHVAQTTGRAPLLYTAKSWLDGRGIKGELLAKLVKYPVWIADYSNTHKAVEKPSVPAGVEPTLWQFASDAKLTTGYKGGLDANIYYGTEADFVRDFGLPQ